MGICHPCPLRSGNILLYSSMLSLTCLSSLAECSQSTRLVFVTIIKDGCYNRGLEAELLVLLLTGNEATWGKERGPQKTKTSNFEHLNKDSFPVFGLWFHSLELKHKTVAVVTIQRLFFHLTFCSLLLLFSIAMPKFLLFILIVLVCLTLIGLYV